MSQPYDSSEYVLVLRLALKNIPNNVSMCLYSLAQQDQDDQPLGAGEDSAHCQMVLCILHKYKAYLDDPTCSDPMLQPMKTLLCYIHYIEIMKIGMQDERPTCVLEVEIDLVELRHILRI